jgi:adenylate cyclase
VSARLIDLATEQDFPFFRSLAGCGKGWAACQRGDPAGLAEIQAGLDLQRTLGARLPRGYYLSYLIESLLLAGRTAEGLAAVREAQAMSETQLDVFYEAEILRLEGELLRTSGDAAAAEAAFGKALGVARSQEARSFELRIAASLGRLLEEQGRAGEALPLLRAAYAAFQEGFATRDLREARALLDRLAPLAEG